MSQAAKVLRWRIRRSKNTPRKARPRVAGLVPYFKIGRAVRFRKSELDAALERMRMK